MRLSAIGLTFQVSPDTYIISSTSHRHGAWNRWYMVEVSRRVT